MKKITIIVKPGSKKPRIENSRDLFGKNVLKVYTKNPPIEGKANSEAIGLLARYLGIPQSELKIVRGLKSKHKTIQIG